MQQSAQNTTVRIPWSREVLRLLATLALLVVLVVGLAAPASARCA